MYKKKNRKMPEMRKIKIQNEHFPHMHIPKPIFIKQEVDKNK